MMSKLMTRFPVAVAGVAGVMEESSLGLDGGKVLFDEKVGLTPVRLERTKRPSHPVAERGRDAE